MSHATVAPYTPPAFVPAPAPGTYENTFFTDTYTDANITFDYLITIGLVLRENVAVWKVGLELTNVTVTNHSTSSQISFNPLNYISIVDPGAIFPNSDFELTALRVDTFSGVSTPTTPGAFMSANLSTNPNAIYITIGNDMPDVSGLSEVINYDFNFTSISPILP